MLWQKLKWGNELTSILHSSLTLPKTSLTTTVAQTFYALSSILQTRSYTRSIKQRVGVASTSRKTTLPPITITTGAASAGLANQINRPNVREEPTGEGKRFTRAECVYRKSYSFPRKTSSHFILRMMDSAHTLQPRDRHTYGHPMWAFRRGVAPTTFDRALLIRLVYNVTFPLKKVPVRRRNTW